MGNKLLTLTVIGFLAIPLTGFAEEPITKEIGGRKVTYFQCGVQEYLNTSWSVDNKGSLNVCTNDPKGMAERNEIPEDYTVKAGRLYQKDKAEAADRAESYKKLNIDVDCNDENSIYNYIAKTQGNMPEQCAGAGNWSRMHNAMNRYKGVDATKSCGGMC